MKLFRHPISKFACLLNWLMIPVSLVLMFAMALSFAATGTWAAVPEPTSGLLMLVGLAGLALRRRRA